ncbi:Phosphatidylinositol 4-kinase gamma 7 [Striga hermonthica]|uniref:1-phosphatidylinositol 4-kinase n=1 Tax=Striga hermonthica TaxID=68872 RepID=A0A9N7RA37_STRHE|nr:Phosphatidylinositol 4-kinase gamma 7 [Striga hermonthica]
MYKDRKEYPDDDKTMQEYVGLDISNTGIMRPADSVGAQIDEIERIEEEAEPESDEPIAESSTPLALGREPRMRRAPDRGTLTLSGYVDADFAGSDLDKRRSTTGPLLCTVFLKEAAANGLCLAEIGEMMSREFRSGEEEPSELEVISIEAQRLAAEEILSPTTKVGADLDESFQFDIDCEDNNGYESTMKLISDESFTSMPFHFGFGSFNGRTLLSRLEETVEEDDDSELADEEQNGLTSTRTVVKRPIAVSKLSVSLNNTSLSDKTQKLGKFSGAKADNGYLANSSSGHRSANEQLPVSVSFVKLADMSEDEWALFLEKFVELLGPAFDKRKSASFGQRQRQRLGTSCKF